jgi:hypothetical protein
MAVKRPLVYSAGEIEVLQNGDRLFGPAAVEVNNQSGVELIVGTPVHLSGSDEVLPARADDVLTKTVFGIVIDAPIAASATGFVARDGVIALTTDQWDLITGGVGGLTPLQKYYLSATDAGRMVTSPPIVDGSYICAIGVAKNQTEMGIAIVSPIKL